MEPVTPPWSPRWLARPTPPPPAAVEVMEADPPSVLRLPSLAQLQRSRLMSERFWTEEAPQLSDAMGGVCETLASRLSQVTGLLTDPQLRTRLRKRATAAGRMAYEAAQRPGWSFDAAAGKAGAARVELRGTFRVGQDEGSWGASAGAGSGGTPTFAFALRGMSGALRVGSTGVHLSCLDVPPVRVEGLAPGLVLVRPAWRESLLPMLHAQWHPDPGTLPPYAREGTTVVHAAVGLGRLGASATHKRRWAASGGKAEHGASVSVHSGLLVAGAYKIRIPSQGLTLGARLNAGLGSQGDPPVVAFAKVRHNVTGTVIRVSNGIVGSSLLRVEIEIPPPDSEEKPGRGAWVGVLCWNEGQLKTAQIAHNVAH